jgi:hypothetical protein
MASPLIEGVHPSNNAPFDLAQARPSWSSIQQFTIYLNTNRNYSELYEKSTDFLGIRSRNSKTIAPILISGRITFNTYSLVRPIKIMTSSMLERIASSL